ncbi:hypothetical protein [Thiohalorhabdus denitrificans]
MVRILQEAEFGARMKEPCHSEGFFNLAYYNWRQKYGGLE